jgi:hypothetical protein
MMMRPQYENRDEGKFEEELAGDEANMIADGSGNRNRNACDSLVARIGDDIDESSTQNTELTRDGTTARKQNQNQTQTHTAEENEQEKR